MQAPIFVYVLQVVEYDSMTHSETKTDLGAFPSYTAAQVAKNYLEEVTTNLFSPTFQINKIRAGDWLPL
jgi:hypothetical protein